MMLSLELRVPIFIVITKIDFCPEEKYMETLSMIDQILEKSDKNPVIIPKGTESDALDMTRYAQAITKNKMVPIFSVSNVTGDGIICLKKFLGLLKSR